MAKSEHSEHQKKVISNYYKNLDTIMLQRLGELVTELYLAKTNGQKKSSGREFKRQWQILR